VVLLEAAVELPLSELLSLELPQPAMISAIARMPATARAWMRRVLMQIPLVNFG
jgi:hypothetical protein